MAFLAFCDCFFYWSRQSVFSGSGADVLGGEKMQQKLRDIVHLLGWGTVALGGILYLVYR